MYTFTGVAAAGLAALSLGLAAPALADGWDSVPVNSGNDTSFNTAYRDGGPQGTPLAGGTGDGSATIAGAPADELPAVSQGANPYVPLGTGH